MTRRHWVVAALVLAPAAAYLYDPPWLGDVTSGMREWQTDSRGVRYRWTNGHASFFVPSGAASITLPLRAAFPGSPREPRVTVRVSADDRWLADITLDDPGAWVRTTLPMPRRPTRRRYRRIDLRVRRTIEPGVLGVQLGEVLTQLTIDN